MQYNPFYCSSRLYLLFLVVCWHDVTRCMIAYIVCHVGRLSNGRYLRVVKVHLDKRGYSTGLIKWTIIEWTQRTPQSEVLDRLCIYTVYGQFSKLEIWISAAVAIYTFSGVYHKSTACSKRQKMACMFFRYALLSKHRWIHMYVYRPVMLSNFEFEVFVDWKNLPSLC